MRSVPLRSGRAPLARVAAAHAIGVPLAWVLAPAILPWPALAAAFAVGFGWLLRLPSWWLAINAVFVPALGASLALDLSPLWSMSALVALLLVYGRIWSSRVPLFFSSTAAQTAIAKLIPQDKPVAFLDAGCGDARVIAQLCASRPDCRFEGIEHAFIPWLLARLRCWQNDGAYYVRRGDLWGHGLTQYDMVFAYLSPAVMPRFWDKVRREMRPGSILVSAFAVPGAGGGEFIDIGDSMNTRLHVCRIGAERAGAP
jgi:SAM-dependent methyltransferase